MIIVHHKMMMTVVSLSVARNTPSKTRTRTRKNACSLYVVIALSFVMLLAVIFLHEFASELYDYDYDYDPEGRSESRREGIVHIIRNDTTTHESPAPVAHGGVKSVSNATSFLANNDAHAPTIELLPIDRTMITKKMSSSLSSFSSVARPATATATATPLIIVNKNASIKRTLTSASITEYCLQHRGSYGHWVLDWDYARRAKYTDYSTHKESQGYRISKIFRRRGTTGQPYRLATAFRWVNKENNDTDTDTDIDIQIDTDNEHDSNNSNNNNNNNKNHTHKKNADNHENSLDCPVTEIQHDTFCHALYTLGITRILILGDSLSSTFTQSLESLLGFPPRAKRAKNWQAKFLPRSIPCHTHRYTRTTTTTTTTQNQKQPQQSERVHESSSNGRSGSNDREPFTFNLDIWMVRRSPIEDWVSLQQNSAIGLKIQDYIENHENRTVIVANMGAWIHSMQNFTIAMDAFIHWVGQLNPEKAMLVYREFVPGHFPCQPNAGIGDIAENVTLQTFDWKTIVKVYPYRSYREYLDDPHRMDMYDWENFEPYNAYARQRLTNLRSTTSSSNKSSSSSSLTVHWLNVLNSSILRRDGHVGFGDCLHYYLPGPTDWWVHFFHSALLDMAKLYREGTTNYFSIQ